jgi:serine/threonine-protein kinase
LFQSPAASLRDEQDAPSAFAPTDSWDSIAPRLQAALFGEFVISRELGRGGMAAVFLAHQLKLNRKVAIKVMAPTLMSGFGLVDRFQVEATTVARLDHPNIISIYQVGESAGLQYFIMQYVAGRSLERVIREHRRLSLEVTRAILFEVGSALAYAHRHQVIHRDVKPGNVLLGLNGRVFVSDFGIAKVAESSARTETGAVVGTPSYMSPEQCLGRPLTWSADQYALGIVAYEMLTGTQPFVGAAYAVMRGHTEEPIPDLLALRPDCPPGVAAAIVRMLGKRPEDRFASMTDALSALGASRMTADEAAQEVIGQLAIPLPDEEGVVLVDTPRSPTPRRAPEEPVVAAVQAVESEPDTVSPSVLERSRARIAAIASLIAEQRTRAANVARAAGGRLGEAVRVVPVLAGRAARRGKTAVSGFWSVVSASSVRARAIVGASVGVVLIGALAVSLARIPTAPAPRDTARAVPVATDTARGSTVGQATVNDSLEVAADSLRRLQEDSLGIIVDSTVPSTLTLIVRPNVRRMIVGESLRFGAIVRDLRNLPVEIPVRWRVSSTESATIDSTTGVLRALAAGTVIVTARADTIERRISLAIRNPNARSPVAQDPDSRDTAVTSPAIPSDPEVERKPIDSAVTAFVTKVLATGDVAQIRERHRPRTPADIEAFDAFIRAMTLTQKRTVRPQSNPPIPFIAGTQANSDVRITVTSPRRLRSDDVFTIVGHFELHRIDGVWTVTSFTMTK